MPSQNSTHKIELIKSQLISHLIINETKLICVTILSDTEWEKSDDKQHWLVWQRAVIHWQFPCGKTVTAIYTQPPSEWTCARRMSACACSRVQIVYLMFIYFKWNAIPIIHWNLNAFGVGLGKCTHQINHQMDKIWILSITSAIACVWINCQHRWRVRWMRKSNI